MLLADSYDEWRICGRSVSAGSWVGGWYRTEPDYGRAKDLKKHNQEVWIERRTVSVTISNARREEVE